MLSTPATHLERLYLPLQRQIPLLSPILSSWQQVGGVPPQHTRMYVATCEPQIIFQEKFTISAEPFFYPVFFPANIRITIGHDQEPLKITPGLPPPAPQSTGFQNIQFSGYFVFFSHSFRQHGGFFPPALAITVYTYFQFDCSASARHLTLSSQQHYCIAPGSLDEF